MADKQKCLTWWGKLRELQPDVDAKHIADTKCPADYFGSHAPYVSGCGEETCCECWNGEYKEPKT